MHPVPGRRAAHTLSAGIVGGGGWNDCDCEACLAAEAGERVAVRTAVGGQSVSPPAAGWGEQKCTHCSGEGLWMSVGAHSCECCAARTASEAEVPAASSPKCQRAPVLHGRDGSLVVGRVGLLERSALGPASSVPLRCMPVDLGPDAGGADGAAGAENGGATGAPSAAGARGVSAGAAVSCGSVRELDAARGCAGEDRKPHPSTVAAAWLGMSPMK